LEKDSQIVKKMNIGFDAKRYFHNGTGLGHYSRSLVKSLCQFYPQHAYFLFNPKKNTKYALPEKSATEINPSILLHKLAPAFWRSKGVLADIKRLNIQLYHGLSHEIPLGIHSLKVKTVVTIHDLIHEKFPEQYRAIDRAIYTRKYTYACAQADAVIAVSEQTASDLIQLYNVPREKLHVCYQSCASMYRVRHSEEEKEKVRAKYKLPPAYLLSVGSIIDRKNLLQVVEALGQMKSETDIPLIVIGQGKKYKEKVLVRIEELSLQDRIIFLSSDAKASSEADFISGKDFPAIYQMATALLYPSYYEGFGIPVLEALCSGLPVITSNTSCLPEAGGDAAYYVNPASTSDMITAIRNILSNPTLIDAMREKGYAHSLHFLPETCAAGVMKVYESIW